MRQRSGNVFRGQENRRSNDAADQQQHGIQKSESANQCGFGAVRLPLCFRRGQDRRRFHYPIPSSSGDSRGVPQRRQITAEQSPQVNGSVTSSAQLGQ